LHCLPIQVKSITQIPVYPYFFVLTQKSNKKSQGCIKPAKNDRLLAKVQKLAAPNSLDFLTPKASHFLNAGFMRPF